MLALLLRKYIRVLQALRGLVRELWRMRGEGLLLLVNLVFVFAFLAVVGLRDLAVDYYRLMNRGVYADLEVRLVRPSRKQADSLRQRVEEISGPGATVIPARLVGIYKKEGSLVLEKAEVDGKPLEKVNSGEFETWIRGVEAGMPCSGNGSRVQPGEVIVSRALANRFSSDLEGYCKSGRKVMIALHPLHPAGEQYRQNFEISAIMDFGGRTPLLVMTLADLGRLCRIHGNRRLKEPDRLEIYLAPGQDPAVLREHLCRELKGRVGKITTFSENASKGQARAVDFIAIAPLLMLAIFFINLAITTFFFIRDNLHLYRRELFLVRLYGHSRLSAVGGFALVCVLPLLAGFAIASPLVVMILVRLRRQIAGGAEWLRPAATLNGAAWQHLLAAGGVVVVLILVAGVFSAVLLLWHWHKGFNADDY